jgi:hypothetical protein
MMGLVGISESNNSVVLDYNKVKDVTKKNWFEIVLLLSELYSKIAVYEYLDVAAALNKSIEEGNDTESIIVLTKQLETLSTYKPGTSIISITRDELRQRVDTFIKEHGVLFTVEMLEDLQLKAENL